MKKNVTKKKDESTVGLQTTALIVSLSVSQWTGRKLDRKITDEVNKEHNASNDAGRYNKLLVSKEHTDPIQKVATAVRSFHYDNTLAWGDNNERLLPAANYFTYLGEVSKFKSQFEVAVANFLKNYDTVIQQAQVRLNGMFNAKDYPTRSEIEEKFGFKTVFMPVPDTDFRVSLSNAEVDKLRESMNGEITNRLTEAVKGVWDRVKEQLQKMRDRLKDSEAVFRDSLFENLKELVDLLPKLNVTNDVNIAKVCVEMKGLIADPEAIRKNSSLRSQKAQDVEQVLNKFGSFFS